MASAFKPAMGTLSVIIMLIAYSMETASPTEGVTVALTFDGEPIWVSPICYI